MASLVSLAPVHDDSALDPALHLIRDTRRLEIRVVVVHLLI